MALTVTPTARKLYALTEGRATAWEPPDHRSQLVTKLVEQGFLRRVKMRCMFEAFGEVGVEWTEAAHAAFTVAAPCVSVTYSRTGG